MKSPCNALVTSAEELGTISKNNLRGITLGIRHMEDSLSYPSSSRVQARQPKLNEIGLYAKLNLFYLQQNELLKI